MKKTFAIFALSVGILFFASCNSGTTTSVQAGADSVTPGKTDTMNAHDMGKMDGGLMSSMTTMMDKMSNMKMTGDPDIDFAAMMVEHHQGAIDMSEIEIKSGADSKLKAMAQEGINKQKEEQSKLREIIKNTKPMKMDMGQNDALPKSMNEMKSDMNAMKMSGNTDRDFAMMMISHHESAIKMARTEIATGMNASLKEMAKKMISDQTLEINSLKKALAEIK